MSALEESSQPNGCTPPRLHRSLTSTPSTTHLRARLEHRLVVHQHFACSTGRAGSLKLSPAPKRQQCMRARPSLPSPPRTLRNPRLDDVAAVLRVPLQAHLVQPSLLLADLHVQGREGQTGREGRGDKQGHASGATAACRLPPLTSWAPLLASRCFPCCGALAAAAQASREGRRPRRGGGSGRRAAAASRAAGQQARRPASIAG